MSELGQEDRRILDFLRERVASGESYLRSKTIANHLARDAGVGRRFFYRERRQTLQ